MDSTIVVSCAGGHIDYRLSRTSQRTYTIEERHIEETPDGAVHVSWKQVAPFDNPKQAWNWLGSKLGWTAE